MDKPRVLVVQGAGMDLRGTQQVEVFGPETLPEIDAEIRAHAADLGLDVTLWQHNDEMTLVAALDALAAGEFAGGVINPSGFTETSGPLPAAIERLAFPMFEVHASNPAARGVVSTILPVCAGGICGFGYSGYRLVLQAISKLIS